MQKKFNHLFFDRKSTASIFVRINLIILFMLISVTSALAKSYSENPKLNTDPVNITELQQVTVTGTVVGSKGEPVIGATVTVKGTSMGVLTDVTGKFTLTNVPKDATLSISFIGMAPQEIPLNGQTRLDVILKETTLALEEVVVVGYGTQKKTTLTGSVSVVKGADLVITPVTNVSNSLSGKLSGVFITTNSSEPGMDGSTINIRGLNTFGNSAPLVVVDGVPGRSLDRIDPNTIDNISLLKDASAAIYGAQAANGVILITTKRGKVGKPTFAISYNQGLGKPTIVPKMCNSYEYTSLISENEIASGLPLTYSVADVKKYQDGSDPLGHPSTDWYREVFKNWSSQNSGNVSISGGTEDFKYFISGSSKFQDGFYKKSASNYKQQDITINLDGKINKYVSLVTNVVGRIENANSPSTVSYGGGIFESLSRSKPMEVSYWPNGLPGPGVEGGANPVLMVTDQMGYNHDKRYIFNSNFNLKIDVPWVKGLSINFMAALDEAFHYNKLWQIPWNTYSWDGTSKETDGTPKLLKSQFGPGGTLDPKLAQNDDRTQNLLTTAQLNYKIKIADKHSFDLLGGVEKIKGETAGMYGYRRGFISSYVDELTLGGPLEKTTFGTSTVSGRLNYFGRLNYNALNKYLVELQFRYQGSYIFYKDNRFGFFPGVSLGWVVSEENFWKNTLGKSISLFKIRASLGKTGNDLVAPYQYLASYYKGGLDMITGGSPEGAIYENVAPNLNATWESVTQKDLGIDMTFLDGTMSFTADYFNNQRSNILAPKNAAVPGSTGLVLPDENIGKVDTKGFDFDISFRNKPNQGGLGYHISFNGVYSKNKLIYWAENPGAPDYQKAEGSPLFAQLYYVSLGVFKDQTAVDNYPHWAGAMPGDVIFKDVNDDGVINDLDKVRRNKNNFPTTSGAISLSVQYKGFDFSTLIQGAAGAERYIFGYSGGVGNYFKDFYDNRWTPQNPNATGPRAYNRNNEYWATSDDWTHQSTQFLHKTDYIRLKTLELGYNLPSSLMNKIGVSNVRIYISAYNLFTYAPDLKDFDPEKSEIKGFGYPQQKVMNFGASLKF